MPRPASALPGSPAVVWAIGEARAPHYWLPRECPRIVFWANPETTADDAGRFLVPGPVRKVIAVEAAWLGRIRAATLYAYSLPNETFTLVDDQAGYFVSRDPVEPSAVTPVGDLLERIVGKGIEVRLTPRLGPLRDALVASTMGYSMIRLRNAAPG